MAIGAAVLATGSASADTRVPWSEAGSGVEAMRAAAPTGWWEVQPVAQAGLRLVASTRVRNQLYELTFTTPNVPGTQETVRVLLPSTYPQDPSTRRYPSLYLLHGCCNGPSPSGARNWTEAGAAEALTAGSGAIVVMPDGGSGGMYTDWADGTWRYESFIVAQLIPWIDTHLRTIPSREHRAIAGLSMGGYGAIYLASRHPDLFSTEGAFSGIVDLLHPAGEASAFVDPYLTQNQPGAPQGVFGNLVTDAITWHDHNPADLAVNLRRSTPPFLEYGDPPTDWIETTANLENRHYTSALEQAGITPTVITQSLQGHTYTVWNDGLKRFLAIATDEWSHPLGAPDGFSYTSASPTFSAFNYGVKLTRAVSEFAVLSDVTASSFAISGSGTGTVTTAARYSPGTDYLVRQTGTSLLLGAGSSSSTSLVTADDEGRLVIPIDLGSSAPTNEFFSDGLVPRPRTSLQVMIDLGDRPGGLSDADRVRARTPLRDVRP